MADVPPVTAGFRRNGSGSERRRGSVPGGAGIGMVRSRLLCTIVSRPKPAQNSPRPQKTSSRCLMNQEYVIVLTTLPADADAEEFATTLVEERLAACVN